MEIGDGESEQNNRTNKQATGGGTAMFKFSSSWLAGHGLPVLDKLLPVSTSGPDCVSLQ